MKKIITFIIYLTFMTVGSLNVLKYNDLTFSVYSNLLFLNIKEFPNLGIDPFSFNYIGSFVFLLIINLFFEFDDINENKSFMALILHKTSTQKNNLRNLNLRMTSVIKSFLILNSLFFLSYLLIPLNKTINLNHLIVVFIYLIKYYLIILAFGLFYSFLSVNTHFKHSIGLCLSLSIFLVFIDLIFKTSVIGFSNNLNLESISILFWFIINLLIFKFSTKLYKGKEFV